MDNVYGQRNAVWGEWGGTHIIDVIVRYAYYVSEQRKIKALQPYKNTPIKRRNDKKRIAQLQALQARMESRIALLLTEGKNAQRDPR